MRTPLVAYTGDTSPAGLDNYPAVFEAKILITEMSFIRANHRREKIHKFGHMHLDDFVERADRFRNEVIVAGHFSTRYHPKEVRKVLESQAAPGFKGADEAVGVRIAGDSPGLVCWPPAPLLRQ